MKFVAVTLAALILARGAAAQESGLVLSPDHWAVAAVGRLHALGCTGGPAPEAGSLARGATERWLDEVADSTGVCGAGAIEASVRESARAYALRLRQETRPPGDAPLRIASLDVHGAVVEGAVLAGYDRDERHVAPARQDDAGGISVRAALAARLGRFGSIEVRPEWSDSAVRLTEGYVSLAAGRVQLRAGRLPVGFPGPGGRSLVLNGATRIDGGGLFLTRTVRLPGFLGAIGPLSAQTFFARLQAMGDVAHPWFWAASVTTEPRPGLGVTLTRAAAFGGVGNSPLSVEEIPVLLLGLAGGAHGEEENQVASVAVRWRTPTPGPPLVVYGEWAFDDMGLSYFHVPGLLVGLQLPSLPGAPGIASGLEWTRFAGHCCGNPPWYRHSALPWIEDRRPLGHPLGGNGSEIRLYSRGELLRPSVHLDAELFWRTRGPENLYAPLRQGESTGVRLDVSARIDGRLEPFGGGRLERGDGWSEWAVMFGTRLLH